MNSADIHLRHSDEFFTTCFLRPLPDAFLQLCSGFLSEREGHYVVWFKSLATFICQQMGYSTRYDLGLARIRRTR